MMQYTRESSLDPLSEGYLVGNGDGKERRSDLHRWGRSSEEGGGEDEY